MGDCPTNNCSSMERIEQHMSAQTITLAGIATDIGYMKKGQEELKREVEKHDDRLRKVELSDRGKWDLASVGKALGLIMLAAGFVKLVIIGL